MLINPATNTPKICQQLTTFVCPIRLLINIMHSLSENIVLEGFQLIVKIY